MYGKIIKIFAWVCFIIFLLFTACLFGGCKSTKGLSDNGIGTGNHRELESEIRDGETELAITSERISNDSENIRETSDEIRQSSEELGKQLNGIESTIRESENEEQELGEVIQRIRTRELSKDKLIELGIKFFEVEIPKVEN